MPGCGGTGRVVVRVLVRLLLALGAAKGCWAASGASAPAAAAATPRSAMPALVLQPCRLPGLATEARCGVLMRPLDPARPDGPQLPLHLAVLPAVARVPLPDPVLFLAGGPGQGAIDLAGPVQALLGRLNNRRDLLLVDVRGTGRSAPLRCPDDGPEGARQPLARVLDPVQRAATVADCRRTLQASPLGDLRHYGTERAAEDLLAALDALRHARVNLVGASYGTRLALEFARQAPERVRRSVLDGVAPPDLQLTRSAGEDLQAALEAVLDGCEREAACAAAHPGLRAQARALLDGPARTATVRHPLTGVPERLTIGPRTVAALLRGPLYTPARRAGLPAALTAAAGGQWEPLVGLSAAGEGARSGAVATGLHLSVVCSEDAPGVPVTLGDAGPRSPFDDPYATLCRDWPTAPPSPGFRQISPARSPVWLLSGGTDPVTPPRHGARTAAALGPQALHTVLPAAGHGLLGLACVRDAVARFIDTPQGEQALAEAGAAGERCAARLPTPPWRRAPGVPSPSTPGPGAAGGAPR